MFVSAVKVRSHLTCTFQVSSPSALSLAPPGIPLTRSAAPAHPRLLPVCLLLLQRSDEELLEGARRPDRHDPARQSCTEILRQREEVSAALGRLLKENTFFYQFV